MKNVNVTIPFTLNFRLLSEAEAADYKKKITDDAAAAAEAARPEAAGGDGRAGPTYQGPAVRRCPRIKAAAERLSKSVRDDSPEVISRALCRAMKMSDQLTKPSILQALKIWATPDAEKTVVAAAKDSSVFVSGPAVEALGNFKSEAAAEVAGAALADMGKRRDAAVALKAMGPIAEPYVIPHVSSHDVFVRSDALDILTVIGGKKSLEALKAELPKAQWHEKSDLQKAIGTIEVRLESGADNAAAAGPDSAATPAAPAADVPESKTRTWHDVTGTYAIEATLVSSADGKVTLKRTDGKELTLPLSKLSAEDQEFVEKQPKPANPFK